MQLLEDDDPAKRAHGISLLVQIRDPDLFQWCAMFLEDEARDVQVAALQALLHCDDADVSLVEPLARSRDKQVRAAAVAALLALSGEASAEWFRFGLTDGEPCVRLETASHLARLDRKTHADIFALALNDPNPVVARHAHSAAEQQKHAPPQA
jgi:HEAT repeat protein